MATAESEDSGVVEQETLDYRKVQTPYRPIHDGNKDKVKGFCYGMEANVDCWSHTVRNPASKSGGRQPE